MRLGFRARAGCSAENVGHGGSRIIGGIDSTSAEDAVIQLRQPYGLCSAVLVAPNLVLTARHCVTQPPGTVTNYQCNENGDPVMADGTTPWPDADVFGNDLDPSSIVVLSGGQGPTPPVQLEASDPLAAHGVEIFHSSDAHHCHTDLALVLLDRTVDDPVLAPLRLDTAPSEGDAVTAVGWGMLLDGGLATTRQQRGVTVVHVGPAAPDFTGDVAVPSGFFSVGESVCAGDSGSPALAASGAVAGVASTLEKPNLYTITSGSDCAGSDARGHYEAIAVDKSTILSAFAAAGAAPWVEGMPDPRASLAAFGDACTTDADCRSGVCVADANGALRCSRGCLGASCPDGYACQAVAGHDRCVEKPVSSADAGQDAGAPGPAHAGGCSVGVTPRSDGAPLMWSAIALAAAALARTSPSRRTMRRPRRAKGLGRSGG